MAAEIRTYLRALAVSEVLPSIIPAPTACGESLTVNVHGEQRDVQLVVINAWLDDFLAIIE